jgi:hypothetical protein
MFSFIIQTFTYNTWVKVCFTVYQRTSTRNLRGNRTLSNMPIYVLVKVSLTVFHQTQTEMPITILEKGIKIGY